MFSICLARKGLPREVGKRFVRVGHSMDILACRHRRAFPLVGVDQFVRQALGDRLALLAADGLENPADRQRLLSLGVHRRRNLICRTTHPLRADFNGRSDIIDRLRKDVDRRVCIRHALFDQLEGIVEDAQSGTLFAIEQQANDELGRDL